MEAQAQYYPGTDAIRGRLSGRALGYLPPWTLFGSTSWDVGTGTVGLNTGAIYGLGNWTLQLGAGGTYAPNALEPWSAQVQLQGSLQFDVPVPESVVQAAGGRRLGALRIGVEADGAPLAGVSVDVGRYRLSTGADGTVSLRLSPGPATVSIDLTQLAANLQLTGEGQQTVTLKDRGTTEVTFELHRTAAVRGQVLVDSNGDGIPDPGAKGVVADIVVEDALGQTHTVTTAKDGSYVVRGLPPGAMTVLVQRTPEGSSMVGPAKRAVDAAPGATAVADFLVQPAIARATVFGNATLRIRAVLPESDTVPPGSAPLVTVHTIGSPESVTLVVTGERIQAVRIAAGTWQARIPVPTAANGVLDFDVQARKGIGSTTRSAELVIQPGLSLLDVAATGVTGPGQFARVEVHTLFEATSVVAGLPGEEPTPLKETAPDHWQGQVRVPAASTPGVVELHVTATRHGGIDVTGSAQIRIVAP